jgi:Leucine-rich repeat (LRR) protein
MKKLLLFITFLGIASGLFAQVTKTVNLTTAGTLSTILTSDELNTVTTLTIIGNIDARDFKTMRDKMPLLAVLDLGSVTIAAYNGTEGTSPYSNGYPANAIPDYAFFNQGTNKGKTSLISVVLPSLVPSIGSYAFSGCTGLTTVAIPSSVTSIGEGAFLNCTGLITVDSNNPNYSSIDGVLFNKTKSSLIQCPISKIGSFTIPSSVTSIRAGAFSDCTGLTTVAIPSSVTSIGYMAFAGCSGLTTVAIPSSVTSIGNYAFVSCSGLTTVTIPFSVTSIGNWAFSYCSGLITVDSNNPNYSSIDGVLYNKTQTSLINCPISKIGSYTIPSSVTSIGVYAFLSCTRLTSVAIPSSVTSIGNSAFAECSGLTTVTMPSSLTSIGSEAFGYCWALTSITTSRLTPLDLSSSSYVFYQVNTTTCTLNVPLGSKSAYQAAQQWKDFTNIVEKNFTGIDPIISDQKLTVYPNPTSGKVKLVFDQLPLGGITLTVNDFTGKTILTQLIHENEAWIDLGGNSPGVYFINTNLKNYKVQKVILK